MILVHLKHLQLPVVLVDAPPGLRSTILTVAEAKGLEFDFVVICDFFQVCGDGASWYAVEEFLKAKAAKTAEKRRKRRTQAQRGMSHNASQRTPSLVRALKALYVAITRSRCGCAFVESGPKSLWGPLLENWQSRSLVKLVDGVSAYTKLLESEASEMSESGDGGAQARARSAAVRLESVQQALAWLWSELQLRTGPEQKKVRKVLGQERLRLQAGHALDPLFMQHFAAAHGVLSQASKGDSTSADGTAHPAAATSSAREQAEEGPWPDLPSLVDVLQLRSRMDRTHVASRLPRALWTSY